MTFQLTINGHAGDGMQGNSQHEIDAVRAFIADLKGSTERYGLEVAHVTVVPAAWSPDWGEPTNENLTKISRETFDRASGGGGG